MQGHIVSNVSNRYEVEIEEKVYECLARGKFKKDELTPVVGDFVEVTILDKDKKEAIIEKILPRINYLKRPKLSNLSQIILVISSKMPSPDLLMLDKQLVYLECLKITPVIIINKIDLDDEKLAEKIKKVYSKIGYKVITTNAKTGEGIETVQKIIRGQTTAFSGNSGVGKSTLLNKLFGEKITIEGEISDKNKKGKNTTTAIKLYKVDIDTYIADTPGFSTFDIEEIPLEKLDGYIKEFEEYISDCKYVGCSHIKEKDCGIKDAVDSGKIAKERYERYIKIYESIKDKEEHKW